VFQPTWSVEMGAHDEIEILDPQPCGREPCHVGLVVLHIPFGPFGRARLGELKMRQAAAAPPARPALPQSSVLAAAVAPPVRPSAPCGASNSSVGASVASRTAKSLSVPEEWALKPKDVFRECGKCPGMVVVPAGPSVGTAYRRPARPAPIRGSPASPVRHDP
jgi:hypothetical protein